MTTTAARVEVLTAEVRVLQVGSRQITMSVYNQLDRVEPGEIEPFGRVAPRDAGPGWVYVVGASARDTDRGALVRSGSETSASLLHSAQRLRQHAAAIVAKVRWLAALPDGRRPAPGEEADRARQLQHRYETIRRDAGISDYYYDGDPDLVNPREDRARALLKSAETSEAEAEDAKLWEALPLIVLAGLR